MNRSLSRPARSARPGPAATVLASALAMAAPLAAQQTFSLPPASPSPTPAPAGPADERAGIAIPPRAVPTRASPTPTASPTIQPLPSPAASGQAPLASPAPRRTPAPAASGASTVAQPVPPPAALPGAGTATEPSAAASPALPPASAPAIAPDPSTAPPVPTRPEGAPFTASLPGWWPLAAGGLGALGLTAAGALLWRRRKPRPLRLAAPAAGAGAAAAAPPAAQEPPRLDLALEITAATRSLMMFTLEYRLTIANRSERAVGDLNTATALACARASAVAGDAAGPSAGTAQALASVDRIGPHQARSVTGTLRLPLSAIAPLRQGQTPLFVPLVHVTLEGESLAPQTRTFVVGTPSASGRVHPIALDVRPGGIAGLVAQAVAIPPASAAA